MLLAIDSESDKTNVGKNHLVLCWRIGGLLFFIVACVMILISFLNYSNYRKAYQEQGHLRHLVTAKDLRQTVESGLNIGLSPSENVRLIPAIKELMQSQQDIRYAAVIDSLGEVIAEGRMAAQDKDAWVLHLANTAIDANWHMARADVYELGMPFINNFNAKAGAVIIGYDRTALESATDTMRNMLSVDVLVTLCAAALLMMAGVYLLTRKFTAELGIVAGAIENTLSAPTSPQVDSQVVGPEMAQAINEFAATSHRAVSEIARLEREIAGVAVDAVEAANK